jgi:hypothetical protein
MVRDQRLQDFLIALGKVLVSQREDFEGRHVAKKVMAAFASSTGEQDFTAGEPLDVLSHIDRAMDIASSASPQSAEVAAMLLPLLPALRWRQTKNPDDPAFSIGHANASIFGASGLEKRSDYTIGVSLAAPSLAYPMHDHPPEELYFLLSPGGFRHGTEDWTDLCSADTFYNTPGVIHAMRAGRDPLLVLWIFGER